MAITHGLIYWGMGRAATPKKAWWVVMPLLFCINMAWDIALFWGWFTGLPAWLLQPLDVALTVCLTVAPLFCFEERWKDIYILGFVVNIIQAILRVVLIYTYMLVFRYDGVIFRPAALGDIPLALLNWAVCTAAYVLMVHWVAKSRFWKSVPLWVVCILLAVDLLPVFGGALSNYGTLPSSPDEAAAIWVEPDLAPVLILVFIFFAVLVIVMEHRAAARDMATAQRQLARYEAMDEAWQAARRLRHDLQNHLQTAATLGADSGDYLAQLQAQLRDVPQTDWCQNPVVNAVLYQKSRQATEAGLAFFAEARVGALPGVAQPDLASLLANLIDNAIENCAPGDTVRVLLRQAGGMLVLRVENPLMPGGTLPKRPGFTTKSGAGHGLGLTTVRRVAADGGGSFSLCEENGLAVATASLGLAEPEPTGAEGTAMRAARLP